MRKRIYNAKYYFKNPRVLARSQVAEPGKEEEEKLYQQLENEFKKRAPNMDVVKQIQHLTFKSRSTEIDDIDSHDITSAVLEKFSFLNHDMSVGTTPVLTLLIIITITITN